ncbi:hypothetical protein RRG08_049907 [Elysia crispata]|uniref:Uncharacterized protein n=1 Tax=Elysia crispata TaxID=231223 RepID=A0AAE0Y093_9GAST|nr:hypothetical protein RRG08_049907 [Elysia crispata]
MSITDTDMVMELISGVTITAKLTGEVKAALLGADINFFQHLQVYKLCLTQMDEVQDAGSCEQSETLPSNLLGLRRLPCGGQPEVKVDLMWKWPQ